jgi:DNA repair exonuclease SbcCD ATPase subunit
MIALLTWVMGKPTQIIMDDRIIAGMKRDMEEKERAFQDKMEEISDRHRHLQKMYDSLREGEEQEQIQQLKQQLYDYSSENRKLATMCKELANEVRSYKPDDAEIETKNRTNLMTEQKEWDVYEKMRDDLQKKTEKAISSHTKDMEKIEASHKKNIEKLTSVYEKKETKYKKEIKTLKHQVKVLKLKMATPDSESDSDSDSASATDS